MWRVEGKYDTQKWSDGEFSQWSGSINQFKGSTAVKSTRFVELLTATSLKCKCSNLFSLSSHVGISMLWIFKSLLHLLEQKKKNPFWITDQLTSETNLPARVHSVTFWGRKQCRNLWTNKPKPYHTAGIQWCSSKEVNGTGVGPDWGSAFRSWSQGWSQGCAAGTASQTKRHFLKDITQKEKCERREHYFGF